MSASQQKYLDTRKINNRQTNIKSANENFHQFVPFGRQRIILSTAPSGRKMHGSK